jgi:hypothetical protein
VILELQRRRTDRDDLWPEASAARVRAIIIIRTLP